MSSYTKNSLEEIFQWLLFITLVTVLVTIYIRCDGIFKVKDVPIIIKDKPDTVIVVDPTKCRVYGKFTFGQAFGDRFSGKPIEGDTMTCAISKPLPKKLLFSVSDKNGVWQFALPAGTTFELTTLKCYYHYNLVWSKTCEIIQSDVDSGYWDWKNYFTAVP